MKEFKLTEMEAKFADIIWKREPVGSGDLVRLCEIEFCWKKSTTYTMLKRLQEKNVFENRNGTVVSLIKKEDFYAKQSKQLLEKGFGGSLPRFVATFVRSNCLSDKEISELQRLIDEHKDI